MQPLRGNSTKNVERRGEVYQFSLVSKAWEGCTRGRGRRCVSVYTHTTEEGEGDNCSSHTRPEIEGGGVGTGVGIEAGDRRDGETKAEEADREKTAAKNAQR